MARHRMLLTPSANRTLITGCEGKTEQCVYDEGSYFAVKASYSNNYSSQSGEKTRFMFLASVLTGEYTLGTHDFRRPPLKDPNNPASDLYDSCVDNEEEPNIFVIFNDEQCYPSYLIKYCLQ